MEEKKISEIRYCLKCLLSELQQLEDVLGKELGGTDTAHSGGPRTEERWLTASEVGTKVGMSGKWVKDRINILPSEFCKRSNEGRKPWLFMPEVIKILNQMR